MGAQLDPAKLKAIADAIDASEVAYSLRLIRLVDEVSTYELRVSGDAPLKFDNIDDAHAALATRRCELQAKAVLEALEALDQRRAARAAGRRAFEQRGAH